MGPDNLPEVMVFIQNHFSNLVSILFSKYFVLSSTHLLSHLVELLFSGLSEAMSSLLHLIDFAINLFEIFSTSVELEKISGFIQCRFIQLPILCAWGGRETFGFYMKYANALTLKERKSTSNVQHSTYTFCMHCKKLENWWTVYIYTNLKPLCE